MLRRPRRRKVHVSLKESSVYGGEKRRRKINRRKGSRRGQVLVICRNGIGLAIGKRRDSQ